MASKLSDIGRLQSVASQAAAQGQNLGSDANRRLDQILLRLMGKISKGGDERLADFG